MSVYKLYAKEVRDQKDLVYIYLYKLNTGEKQPTLISLKVKIPKKYCLPSYKDFKKVSKEIMKHKKILLKTGFDDVEKLNNYLEERFETFQRNNGRKETLPLDKKTLNEWFEILINRQINQGTKLRYTNVYNLLIQFQYRYSGSILKRQPTQKIFMKDIDVDYILEFQKWLLSEPNEGEKRKRSTLNTSNYKLKCLKSIINKAHIQEYFPFHINPFDHIVFSNVEPKIDILTMKELKSLITTQFVEVYRRTIPTNEGNMLWGEPIEGGVESRNERNSRYKAKHSLNDVRNYFLFQLLSQGIRVSDLATLRWSNFDYYDEVMRINKRMVKTKANITILVNEKMTGLISHYIVRYKNESPELIDKIVSINNKITYKYNYLNSLDFTSTLFLNELEMKNTIKAIGFVAGKEEYFQHHTSVGFIISQNLIDRLETYLYDNVNDFWSLMNYKPIKTEIIYDRSILEIDNIISSLNKWLIKKKQEQYNIETSEYIKLKAERNVLVFKLINELKTKKVKDDFVFNLLRNEDFKDIVKEDFSRLSEEQYRKFQSFRAYYNKLLKLVSKQANINKNLTSHIARHSYASLMLELGENINLFDLMTSLGHQRLATTQTYIQRLSNKKIDQLNKVISDSLNTGINLNL
ncbi:MAG: tyrosine-type recombinase/integrase [Flavobacterium sp.]|uniref:tyrosine-type recombinase/integrase n=1 Tax=Flavobacterium sp. TaxID=239 RepID=UPI003BB9D0AE